MNAKILQKYYSLSGPLYIGFPTECTSYIHPLWIGTTAKYFFLLLFLMLQIQITVNKTETLRSTSYYFQAWKYYLWDLQYFRAPKELNSTWFTQEGVKAASENYFTLWFDLCLFWMWCKPWLIIGRCAKECPVWHNSRKINEMFACSFWFWEERAERL